MKKTRGPGKPLRARKEALRKRHQLPEPVRRQEATQATVDKFKGQPFDWNEGVHCVKLAHYHLKQMGWRSPKLPTLPVVHSALAAKKAMKARGWDTVEEMLDQVLGKGSRIPPAMMQLGDMAVVEGDAGFGAVFLCVGPRRLAGWSEAEVSIPTVEEQDRFFAELLAEADSLAAMQRASPKANDLDPYEAAERVASDYVTAISRAVQANGKLIMLEVSLNEVSAAWRVR